jgi:hypothetical protein
MFFFEKKEPKNFSLFGSAYGTAIPRKIAAPWERDKSLFASFSSEKEGIFCL